MADATSSGLQSDLSSYAGYGSINKLIGTPSNNPDNANAWLNVGRQQVAMSQQQFDLNHQKLQAINDLASSVLANPTPDNAQSTIMRGMKMGVIDPDVGATEMQTIQGFGDGPDAPAKIKAYAWDATQKIADYNQRVQAAGYAPPQLVNNGQADIPVTFRSGPQGGAYQSGGNPLQQFMSPSQANAPTSYRDPTTGRDVQTTVRGYNQAVGDPAGLPPAQGASAPALQPSAGSSGVGNPSSYVDPQRAAAQGVQVVNGKPVYGAPAPAPPGTQPGDVVKPGPVGGRAGSTSSSRGPIVAGAGINGPGAPQPTVPGIAGPSPMLAGGIEDYRSDLNNSAAKLQVVQPLLNALPLIRQLGATGSGPGTKTFNDAKSALVSAGIIPAGATDVEVRDEANKYLTQYVARSGIAQRSDMGTLVSQQSSPNLDTSNQATDALTQNAIAMDRMEAARPLAYQNNDLSGYDQHKASWTQSQDLRAYKLDVMPADQRTALLNSMAAKRNTAEGRKFFTSLQTAMASNVVQPPSAQTPAMGAPGGQ